MFVKERFAVVDKAPFAHDASSPAHDAAQALVCQMHIVTADSGMDGEVVHSLFTLLDERIFIDFPCQVFHLAVYFFQSLVDGHCAHGNGTVAHNPFACLVDVVAGREIHQRITAPFAAPYRLVHLFFNDGSGGGIADVGVYLEQKVASDNHRFAFRVIDVGRQHGAPGGNLVANELGRNVCVDAQFLAVHVFADGYIFHFRSDDTLLGIIHLRAALSCFCTVGQGDMFKAQMVERRVVAAHLSVFGGDGRKLFHIAS